jgi:hypothetical protein
MKENYIYLVLIDDSIISLINEMWYIQINKASTSLSQEHGEKPLTKRNIRIFYEI